MPAFLIPWLFRLGALIAVGLFLYGMWWKVDHTCWSSACKREAVRAEAAENALVAAQERATALALLWASAIEKVQVVYRDKVIYRERTVASLRERVGKINDQTLVPISPPAIAVLRDAESFANATDPPAPGTDQVAAEAVPETARDTTVQEWVAFAVEASAAYRDAADKHMACVSWANSITQAQAATASSE